MFRKIIKGFKDVWCGALEFDTEPKKGSFNPVTSGGVYDAINGAGGAKEIVYFDVDPSDPPSGIYEAIGEALSNNKLPAIRSDGKLYQYTSTDTDVYNFVGVFSNDGVGYELLEVFTDDNVQVGELNASLGYATLLADGTEENPAWAKICELDLDSLPVTGYKSFGLTLLFNSNHNNEEGGQIESGIFSLSVGTDQQTTQNSFNGAWTAYTPSDYAYSKILGIKVIAKYGAPNPPYAAYPVHKVEVWVKYYNGDNIIVNALQNSLYNYGMSQGLYKFPEDHRAVPQSTEPSYSDTEEYVYYNKFYAAESPNVAYTHAQSLTSEQKAQGRDNIGAASASDVTALQSQVSSLSDVSAYTVKGEATVAQLNAGPSGIQAGWAYQLTDSGTLTAGSLAVVVGDTVAWDGTKWFPLVKSDYYATQQEHDALTTYAQNVAHSIAPEFDPTRTSENPYKAGEVVMYTNGKSYRFRNDHYGPWNVYDVEETDVASYVPLAVSASSQLQYGFVSDYGFKLGGGVGSSVDKYRVYNAGVNSIEFPCKENDMFVLYGVGGNTYRLYAFINSSREILSVAIIDKDASDGLRLVAPQGAASLIVNLVGDGKVYKLSKDSSDNANTKAVNNIVLLSKVSLKNVVGGYIKTNENLGSTVNITPVSQPQYVHQVINVQMGERYFIYGVCGDVGRLWCFVDSEDKVVAKYTGANTGALNEIEIDAPCNGKLIVNFNVSNDYDILGLDASKASNDILETASDVKNNVYAYDKKNTYNGYVATNVGVGNAVSYDVVYGNTYTNAVFDCEKGDSFAIKGSGGSVARLWCFVDSEDKVVSVANASTSTGQSVLYLTAPSSGKFIFNSATSVDYFVSKKEPLKDIAIPELDFLTANTPTKENLIDFSIAHRGRVATNVGSGNVVSYDVTYATDMAYVIRTCKKDDVFFIRGRGGSVARLWCFVDSEDKVVDSATANATANDIKLTAPCDGKFIFNSYVETNVGVPYCKVWGNTDDILSKKIEEVDSALTELENRVIEYDGQPYDDITDYSSDITEKWMPTMMDIVYAKFDTLISEAPGLITKYDAAELVDMEYPRYANGISAGDPDYLETPPYKTYIYKISNINANVGNTGKWAKKKIFITGSIHGLENLSGFNLFALASHIIRKPSKDLFAILAKFDIWLIPFVNGYGVYHTTRYNANGIDINRNFGTAGWTVTGTPGGEAYSGQTPDSEFETQLVEALKNYIHPDFYVDHHCTPHYAPSQLYSFTFNEKIWQTSYMALVDFSKSLIDTYPEYFGTKYHLFKDELLTGTLPTSPAYPGYDIGKAPTWFHEQGVAACCIEIFSFINYLNGVVSEQLPFGDDVHVVNEMSLRCQLDYYLRAVLG